MSEETISVFGVAAKLLVKSARILELNERPTSIIAGEKRIAFIQESTLGINSLVRKNVPLLEIHIVGLEIKHLIKELGIDHQPGCLTDEVRSFKLQLMCDFEMFVYGISYDVSARSTGILGSYLTKNSIKIGLVDFRYWVSCPFCAEAFMLVHGLCFARTTERLCARHYKVHKHVEN